MPSAFYVVVAAVVPAQSQSGATSPACPQKQAHSPPMTVRIFGRYYNILKAS